LPRDGLVARGRDLRQRLPGAPGRDPLPRVRVRDREPARRHLLRVHQPADQAQLMSVAEIEASQLQAHAEGTTGLWSEAWYRLIRNPGAIIGGVFVSIFVTVAVFAPWIAPYGPKEQNLNLLNEGKPVGPTHGHWFGVDLLGRDEFSRIVWGARYSLLIGVVSVTIGLSIGLVLGATAGYLGGLTDSTIMRLMDVMLAIPGLLFAIGIGAALGPGLWQVMLAGGVVNIPIFARLLRGSVLAQRENDFVLRPRQVG